MPNAVPLTDTTYYISASGTGDGLTSGTPMSVASLLALTITNKTHLRFNRGDTFNGFGDFTFASHSGSIQAYGTGAKPIIYTSTDISGNVWTDEGSNRWSTPMAETPKWVYFSDIAGKLATTTSANGGWIQITATPSSGVVRVATSALSGYASSLVGAKLRCCDADYWLSYEYTVTDYNAGNGNITLDRAIPEATTGRFIILYGQVQFLSANNDWAYDSATQKLWIRNTSNPSGLAIRVSTKDNCFLLSAWNIDIDDLDIRHANVAGFYGADGKTGGISIENCSFNNNHGRAVLLINTIDSGANSNALTNCGIDGIRLSGDGLTCRLNTVDGVGMDANFQMPTEITNVSRTAGTGIGVRSNLNSTRTNLCELNVVSNTAWVGIVTNGKNMETRYNHVQTYLKRLRDGSGVYTSGSSAEAFNYGVNIHHNQIHDGAASAEITALVSSTDPPSGIYVDNFSFQTLIDNNFIYNLTGPGIKINFNSSISSIRNNTISNCVRPLLFVATTPGNISTGNIIVARGSAGYCVEVNSGAPFTTADNNIYINPYTDKVGLFGSTLETLAQWRTRFSKDASSTAMVNYIVFTSQANSLIEIMREINWTNASVNFNIPAGYKQHTGTSGGTVSIPAYSGIVYLKETAA